MKKWPSVWVGALFTLCSIHPCVYAQDDESYEELGARSGEVNYPASFFDRYQPATALDMVQRVPGFQLNDGGDRRGFGAAAGNILLNGRRPSTKDDLPSALLTRIPASYVENIELIRGQLRGIDMRGQSVVANVILREDTPVTTRWTLTVGENFEQGLSPQLDLTLSNRLGEIQYSVGTILYVTSNGDPGPENIFDADGNLIERRFNDKGHKHGGFEGYDATGFFNAATWLGETQVQFNTKAAVQHRNMITSLSREPVLPFGGLARTDDFVEQRRNHIIELGLDAERFLSTNLIAKGILLYNYTHQYPNDSQRTFDAEGRETRYILSDTDADISEAIARLELNWAGWQDHALQFNIEGALNVFDKQLIQTTDIPGEDSLVEPVPGGNNRIKEERGDFVAKDTWSLGSLTLDYGVGVEVSTLSSTGDTEQSNTFTFVKPEALFTYDSGRQMQTRLGVRKSVAQLNLNDFLSISILQDNDLTVGNPDLKPQATWVYELSNEWRFGELGVVTLTGFYHSIKDVIDLLPFEIEGRPDEFFEGKGNIGDGKRWGLRLDNTLALDWIGLSNARIDMQLGWQDSSVTDPVTGEKRVMGSTGYFNPHPPINFTNETEWTYIIDYRQDFQAQRISWGGRMADQAERPQFKTNELDIRDAGIRLGAFIETTRWWNMNIKLAAENILDFSKDRDRTVFTGLRDRSTVDFVEVERRTIGTDIILTVTGSF
jgi:outer membrane receptor protein involved in Fe transport